MGRWSAARRSTYVRRRSRVCARILADSRELDELKAVFSTMTADLLALRDWLGELGVTHVTMEATGVFWKPIVYVLEHDFELLLVKTTRTQLRTLSSSACWRGRRGRSRS